MKNGVPLCQVILCEFTAKFLLNLVCSVLAVAASLYSGSLVQCDVGGGLRSAQFPSRAVNCKWDPCNSYQGAFPSTRLHIISITAAAERCVNSEHMILHHRWLGSCTKLIKYARLLFSFLDHNK